MKKLISIAAALSLVAASSAPAFAADKEARQPDVYVQGRKVVFVDQNAYITDEGRTLVPARGVFEYMGCEVGWDADNYEVTVLAKDETEVKLKIDSDQMTVKKGEDVKTKTLDCPAQLMNDRTMVPLRAISEALQSTIVWNEGAYAVYITPKTKISADEFKVIMDKIKAEREEANKPAEEPKVEEPKVEEPVVKPEVKEEDKLKMSLSTETVKPGETAYVKVYIDQNPGVTAIGGELIYSEDLIFTEIAEENIFTDPFHGYEKKPPYFLLWSSDLATENITYTGLLATLSFDIPEDTPKGEYEIEIEINDYNTFNFDFVDVFGEISSGKIIVE